MTNRLITFFMFAVGIVAPTMVAANGSDISRSDVGRAALLLDTHYGRSDRLEQAAKLLNLAFANSPHTAEHYVQAARLTVKGGYINFQNFQSGTIVTYTSLLDKAIALDPANTKAKILKAEALLHSRDLDGSKRQLDAARALGTTDPWLWIGYARYFEAIDNTVELRRCLDYLQRPQSQSTPLSVRNAYVAGLQIRARTESLEADPSGLRKLANEIRAQRHPDDAWALSNLAAHFNRRALFEEGISLAREALRVMNHGVAELALAVGLYGRAAELVMTKRKNEASALIVEAKALGFSRESILRDLKYSSSRMTHIRRTLEQLIE